MSGEADDDELAMARTVAPRGPVADELATRIHRPGAARLRAQADEGPQRVMALVGDTAGAGVTRFRVHEVLGEGGMSVVHLAEQRSLGRKVVLKALPAERRGEEEALRLVQEAWVTGRLEHPNIVPVHDVIVEADGSPVIVLKRIEGETWTALMRDAPRVRERFAAADLLEWNLRLLIQVSHAVEFAHSRGIIHCDLKPDNVMIGAFGEVYVLDWGIALSLRDDGGGRLPLAAEAQGPAGTPAYMAPEMLGGDGARLSEKTDVYLLGAILHELLTGLPPHRGATVTEVLARAGEAAPPTLPGAPTELAAICRRALAADPDARFPSVAALRLALQGYLGRRGAAALIAEADRRRAELCALAAAPGSDGGRRQALYNLYGACKFGYREALRTWPEGQAASAGLAAATAALVDYELARGEPRTAAALLDELGDAPADLRARVDAALAVDAAERSRVAALARLGAELDPKVGQRTRTFVSTVLGVVCSLAPLLAMFGALGEGEVALRESLIVTSLLFLGLTVGLGAWARESLMKTAVNRTLLAATVLVFSAQTVLVIVAPWVGIGAEAALTLLPFVWSLVAAMLAIAIEPWITVTALAFFAAFLVGAWRPELRFYAFSLANLAMTINAVLVWAPPEYRWWRRRG